MSKRVRFGKMVRTGLLAALMMTPLIGSAKMIKTKVIDDGSSGPYKAIAATEESLPDFVVYRPENIRKAVAEEGKLPVLVWANGGCMDSSIHHERLLSEVASHGYVIVAIGKLQMTVEERVHKPTSDTRLLDAIEWISEQEQDRDSDYYHCVDLDKIAAGGQSCGGAQTMRVAGDLRIKTYMMCNSGMGDMSMAGASKESLKALHGPVLYMVGGPADVAYSNAKLDYERIEKVPVALASVEVGHGGTFNQPYGGSFAKMALSWLDWQLKGVRASASVFLQKDLDDFPGWTMTSKQFRHGSVRARRNWPFPKIRISSDICYREGDSGAWTLDLAMPHAPATGLRPALVIVHGGGWAAGDKTDEVYQTMMKEYAHLGYVTINVNYRLTREAEFPACIEDVKCAVRWLRAHAEEYQIDPDRIGAYGHSAGAHLALMLAMVPESAGLEGDGGWDGFSSRVNVVAAGSPPTELGRDVPMAKPVWWPIGYIGADHPPMFLIQGLQDRVVRPELTTDFVEKMKAAGADIKYLTMDGHHGIAFDQHLDVTKPALEKFFKEHLKPGKTSGNTASVTLEQGGTGPYSAIATEDPSLPGMTIFRPSDLSAFGGAETLPVVLWGNGACANTTFEHKNFLNELASQGYIILAIGLLDQMEERGATSREPTYPEQLIGALDWIEAQNRNVDTMYAGKIAIDHVGVMGMSCGGLQAIAVADDPRLDTVVVCNSGVLPEPSPLAGMPPLSKDDLKKYHTPVLYIIGGPSDIAYDNAMDDFKQVKHVPIVMTNLDVGHAGTYMKPHGGAFTPVALSWLNWHLKGMTAEKSMFLGEDSVLNRDPKWTVEAKNF